MNEIRIKQLISNDLHIERRGLAAVATAREAENEVAKRVLPSNNAASPSPAAIPSILTEGLTKVYRGHIGRGKSYSLDQLTLRIEQGEVFGFLGRNGAGKTTTIKMLCSLLRPSAGRAEILGYDARSREARRYIGYLPENPYFYEYLTPRETIDFYGRLNGLSRPARNAEWEKLASLLDLESIANQRVRSFSKGMRQRLGFAVAMVGDPPVLILDEPMSGLDPLGRRAIRQLILRLRDENKTIFFSSHVLGDVEQICDRVGILNKGRLTAQGAMADLLDAETHEVEVVATGLKAPVVAALTAGALRVRVSEAGTHFHVRDPQTANEFVRTICQHGGALVEFSAVKDSLEDFFMRHQDLEL